MRKSRKKSKLIIFLKWHNFLGLRYYPALFYISTILLGICIIYPIIIYFLTAKHVAGEFGDQYGFINALISGLAFAAFWSSLKMQHKELQLQRKELRRANKESQQQTEQFENQTNLLKAQIEEEREKTKNQLALQERTVWMQETMELISRFSDELRSIQCSFGYNPSTQQYITGRTVTTLLLNAVVETCVQNFAIEKFYSNNPNAIPALPNTIKNGTASKKSRE